MYVYLIEAVGVGMLKIGASVRPKQRLGSLQGACPTQLALVGFFRGEKAEERRLHKLFGALRTHHEWFQDVPEIREEFSRQETWIASQPLQPPTVTDVSARMRRIKELHRVKNPQEGVLAPIAKNKPSLLLYL